MVRLYLDLCCLNRPFDDQSQPRVALETLAIEHVLDLVRDGVHQWIISEALLLEIRNAPDAHHRRRLRDYLADAVGYVALDATIAHRARLLMHGGFGAFDALHLASAVAGAVDAVLTTDDTMLRRAARYHELEPLVHNPIDWLREGRA